MENDGKFTCDDIEKLPPGKIYKIEDCHSSPVKLTGYNSNADLIKLLRAATKKKKLYSYLDIIISNIITAVSMSIGIFLVIMWLCFIAVWLAIETIWDQLWPLSSNKSYPKHIFEEDIFHG